MKIEPFGDGAIRSLSERVFAKHQVSVSDEALNAFVNRVLQASPTPFYVVSVAQVTERGTLTVNDIKQYPEDAEELWQDQYEKLLKEDREPLEVLISVKLLSEVRIPLYESLIKGLYQRMFGHNVPLRRGIDPLVEKQWLNIVNSQRDGAVRYDIHDIKLNAVDERIEDRLGDLSDFLLRYLEEYKPDGMTEFEQTIHGHFANVLQKRFSRKRADDVEDHYCRSLLLTSPTGDLLDSDCAGAHNDYAIFLREENRLEESANHYRRALILTSSTDGLLDSNHAAMHNNYANLLTDENQPEEAKDHYQRALILTSSSGNPLDSDYADAHDNYANLLKEEDRLEEAANHYQRSLLLTSPTGDLIDSGYADAHNDYANLLSDEGQLEDAEEHFQRALLLTSSTDDPLDSDHATAHNNYAVLLDKKDRSEAAANHYCRSLLATSSTGDPLDSDYANAHNNYAVLLRAEDRSEKAEDHFRRALMLTSSTDDLLDSDHANAHYNYANLLIEAKRLGDARSHLEASIYIWIKINAITNALNALFILAQVCEALGDTTVAIEQCERALHLIEQTDAPEAEAYERQSRDLYIELLQRDC
jgi:tetratricopeptide (TPR) repeat protein